MDIVSKLDRFLMKWIVVIMATLALAGTASAHNTTWYWGNGRADNVIINEGLKYTDGFHEIVSANCYGWGKWIPSDNGKYRLWKHFRCHVIAATDENYWITLHVTGKFTWVFYFLRWG